MSALIIVIIIILALLAILAITFAATNTPTTTTTTPPPPPPPTATELETKANELKTTYGNVWTAFKDVTSGTFCEDVTSAYALLDAAIVDYSGHEDADSGKVTLLQKAMWEIYETVIEDRGCDKTSLDPDRNPPEPSFPKPP